MWSVFCVKFPTTHRYSYTIQDENSCLVVEKARIGHLPPAPAEDGILLMPNKYPVVEAAFEEQINEMLNLPEETPLVLLYYQNQDFYFYAHSQAKIWHIRSKDVCGWCSMACRMCST